jgi:GNAT superfamily N-acetyltransferase
LQLRPATPSDIDELLRLATLMFTAVGVATDETYRRRGAARTIMDALVRWARERNIAFVDLHASPDGDTLYRSMGFVANRNPELRLRLT